MSKNPTMDRRHVLRAGVALSAAAGLPRSGYAAPKPSQGEGTLPARTAFVIRNAYVMTMDDAGDIANADVHVADGVIVAVGQHVKATGASSIDGRGMIVLPGLVETHWHMWNTLLRSMSGDKPEFGYFRTTATLGAKYSSRRYVPGHAIGLRRGHQQRHHSRPRLVP